jgi:hypothetical protein
VLVVVVAVVGKTKLVDVVPARGKRLVGGGRLRFSGRAAAARGVKHQVIRDPVLRVLLGPMHEHILRRPLSLVPLLLAVLAHVGWTSARATGIADTWNLL